MENCLSVISGKKPLTSYYFSNGTLSLMSLQLVLIVVPVTLSILNGNVLFYTNSMDIPQHDVIVHCVYHKTVTQVSISLVTPLLLYCTVY